VRRTVEARSVVAEAESTCLVEDGVSVDSDVGFPGLAVVEEGVGLAVGGHMEDDCMQVVVGGGGGVLNIVSIPLNFPVRGRPCVAVGVRILD